MSKDEIIRKMLNNSIESDKNTEKAMHAIKKKCLYCTQGSTKEVKLCPIKRCPLWGYRGGKEDLGYKYNCRNKKWESRQ